MGKRQRGTRVHRNLEALADEVEGAFRKAVF